MDEPTRQRYETQAKDLRVKIKTWEGGYCNDHGGKKPSREDIKNAGMSRLFSATHHVCPTRDIG